MKYYQLEVLGMPVYNYEPWEEHPANFYYFLESNKIPEHLPVFSYQVLETKRVTDFTRGTYGASSKGFIVNEKAKNILKSINIHTHKYYKIKILQEIKGQPVAEYPEYTKPFWYLMLVNQDFETWIDFKKSIFYVEDTEENSLTFDSIESFKESAKCNNLGSHHLVLNESFVKLSLDLFVIPNLRNKRGYYYIIVSENLKNVIQKNKLTGIEEFIEVPIYV